jgi:hypothetical protein
MKFIAVRKFALSLPEVVEAPHHNFNSFRVRGKIFVTAPPDEAHIHVFVSEQQREQALVLYSDFTEKLLWGGKVVGIRIELALANSVAVKRLVYSAWQHKAPVTLVADSRGAPVGADGLPSRRQKIPR